MWNSTGFPLGLQSVYYILLLGPINSHFQHAHSHSVKNCQSFYSDAQSCHPVKLWLFTGSSWYHVGWYDDMPKSMSIIYSCNWTWYETIKVAKHLMKMRKLWHKLWLTLRAQVIWLNLSVLLIFNWKSIWYCRKLKRLFMTTTILL